MAMIVQRRQLKPLVYDVGYNFISFVVELVRRLEWQVRSSRFFLILMMKNNIFLDQGIPKILIQILKKKETVVLVLPLMIQHSPVPYYFL